MSSNKPRDWDRRLVLGVMFMCLSGVTSSAMNGVAKLLTGHYSSIQVSWARTFGHVLFMLAVFMPRKGIMLLRTRRLGWQLTRSSCLIASNLSFFFALSFIPIGDAAAINMIGPIFVAALAWPLLSERTTPGRVMAVLIGFASVLVIIRPGTDVFHWAALFIIFSALTNALYQIITRYIADTEAPETLAIYSPIVGAFGMLFVLPFVWRNPDSAGDIALLCSLGVLGAVGHYFVALSLGFAPANLVTPFQYVQLVGSVGVGYVVFGTLPDGWTWLGSVIVVACGLYIGWTQTRRQS